MESINTHLFIGGMMDGQRKETDDKNRRRISFPKQTGYTKITRDDSFEPTFSAEEYRCEWIRAADREWRVWIVHDMTVDEAMARLIENYRPVVAAVTP